MKNKRLIVLSVVLLSIILFFSIFDLYGLLDIQGEVGPLAHKIMDEIDRLADDDGECILNMNELTDFDWDMMIVVNWYFSIDPTKEMPLDIKFKQKNGIWSYLIFLKNNEIVYEEAYRASFETLYKFNLFFEYGGQYYRVFTQDNALIIGRRFTSPDYSTNDPKAPYFYSLVFEGNNPTDL